MLCAWVAGTVVGHQVLREISYSDGVFTLKGPLGAQAVPIGDPPRPMNRATGRIWLPVGQKAVVFDKNGVGIRQNNKIAYSTYPSVATSDQLFTKEQIDATNRAAANGERSLDVTAVSGFAAVGSKVYLLLRWDGKRTGPWLEPLMEIDLSSSKPAARVVARFNGFTTAKGKVSDKLCVRQGKLWTTVVHDGKVWLCSYNLTDGKVVEKPVSRECGDVHMFESSGNLVAFQVTPVGTTIVSAMEPDSGRLRQVAEIRGSILEKHHPDVIESDGPGGRRLMCLTTGAVRIIAPDEEVRSLEDGMLVWSPKTAPKSAKWITSSAFRELALWPPTPAPTAP